jgi:fibronectin type 3 domain-containing protein
VVRSVKTTEKVPIESGDSGEVESMPADLTPPAPPRAIIAFQSPEGIVITWEPNTESDLLGYYVYRRLENQDKTSKISPLLTRETMYLDKTCSPGVTYYYAITAVDRSLHHNESSFSQELKVAIQPR